MSPWRWPRHRGATTGLRALWGRQGRAALTRAVVAVHEAGDVGFGLAVYLGETTHTAPIPPPPPSEAATRGRFGSAASCQPAARRCAFLSRGWALRTLRDLGQKRKKPGRLPGFPRWFPGRKPVRGLASERSSPGSALRIQPHRRLQPPGRARPCPVCHTALGSPAATPPRLSTPRARLISGTQGPRGHHPPGHGGQREPTATADVPAVPQPHDRERSPSGGGRISSARRCSRSRLSSAGRRSWGGMADVGHSRLRAGEHGGGEEAPPPTPLCQDQP